MTEYHYAMPSTMPEGRTVFTVRNSGQARHEMTIVALPADFPPLDAHIHSGERTVLTNRFLLPPVNPGQESVFAMDLTPGRYGVLSFIPAPDGTAEDLLGMNAEFRVP